MSRQRNACRTLGDSIEIAETMIFENVLQSINDGKLLLDELQLQTLKQNINSALRTAKSRGIDQMIKVVLD